MENNFAPKIIHVISRMNVGGPARMIQELMHIDKSVAEQFLITGICQEGEIDFRDSHPELHSIELKNLGRDINLISDLIFKSSSDLELLSSFVGTADNALQLSEPL